MSLTGSQETHAFRCPNPDCPEHGVLKNISLPDDGVNREVKCEMCDTVVVTHVVCNRGPGAITLQNHPFRK